MQLEFKIQFTGKWRILFSGLFAFKSVSSVWHSCTNVCSEMSIPSGRIICWEGSGCICVEIDKGWITQFIILSVCENQILAGTSSWNAEVSSSMEVVVEHELWKSVRCIWQMKTGKCWYYQKFGSSRQPLALAPGVWFEGAAVHNAQKASLGRHFWGSHSPTSC